MIHVLITLFLVGFIAFALADGAPSRLFPRLFPRLFEFVGQTLGLANRWTHFHSVHSRVQDRLRIVLVFSDGRTRAQLLRAPMLRSGLLDKLASHKMSKIEFRLLSSPSQVLFAAVGDYVRCTLPPDELAQLTTIEFRRLIVVVPPMDATDKTVGVKEEALFTFAFSKVA